MPVLQSAWLRVRFLALRPARRRSPPRSRCPVVSLYYATFASGIRQGQAISAMAVIYMLTTLVILVVTLRYVSPTQLVGAADIRTDKN